jgi:hypothetical protein
MKKRIWTVTISGVLLASAIVGSYIGYNNYKAWAIDRIDMKYSSELTKQMPKIQKQMQYFQRNGRIQLYEFTDTASFNDSVVYYYFTGGFDEKLRDKFDEAICSTEGEDSAAYDSIYYYSLLLDKYDIKPSEKYCDHLRSCEADLTALSASSDISYLNFALKTDTALSAAGLVPDSDFLEEACKKDIDCFGDHSSELSCEIIRALASENNSEAEELLKKITDEYVSETIDIESYIILLGLFPDDILLKADKAYIQETFQYNKVNYYYQPLYLNFISFKNAELLGLDEENVISDIYRDRPLNNDGFTSEEAYIIPTYRRIYQYRELCSVLGINIDDANVYEIAAVADERGLTADDYYYQTLTARDYHDIDVDIDELKKLISKASDYKVSDSNYYSLYYLVKTALMNKLDCSRLMKKLIAYNNPGSYLIIDILHEELEYLDGERKSLLKNFDEDILRYDGDSPIDVYYNYFIYLKTTGQKPSSETAQKIRSVLEDHYIENDHGGGYFRNEEFRYIDISLTYESIFILNMLSE